MHRHGNNPYCKVHRCTVPGVKFSRCALLETRASMASTATGPPGKTRGEPHRATVLLLGLPPYLHAAAYISSKHSQCLLWDGPFLLIWRLRARTEDRECPCLLPPPHTSSPNSSSLLRHRPWCTVVLVLTPYLTYFVYSTLQSTDHSMDKTHNVRALGDRPGDSHGGRPEFAAAVDPLSFPVSATGWSRNPLRSSGCMTSSTPVTNEGDHGRG